MTLIINNYNYNNNCNSYKKCKKFILLNTILINIKINVVIYKKNNKMKIFHYKKA